MKQVLLPLLTLVLSAQAIAGANLSERLKAIWPEYTVESIEQTPIPNLLSVKFKEVADTAYVTKDGNYLVEGQVLDLKGSQPRNLQDIMTARKRAQSLAKLPATGLLVRYASTQPTKHRLFVLIDTDCGFCQRFHDDLPKLQKTGIEVNLLPYPREGIGSHAAQLMERIWCQDEAPALLTQVMKQGESLLNPGINCPKSDTISQGIALGKTLGVVGTPAIFTEDGEMLGGYLAPNDLIKRLEN